MLNIGQFCISHQKITAGQHRAHARLAPGTWALKMTFLPILEVKNSEIQKFSFLQISLFLGQIDGINNIFSSGLPFWLYRDS